jgi:hypothetical protein
LLRFLIRRRSDREALTKLTNTGVAIKVVTGDNE